MHVFWGRSKAQRFEFFWQGLFAADEHSTVRLQQRHQALLLRLAEAAQVLAGEETTSDALSGLLPASQLAGLSPEEANAAVLDALAQRAYQGGSVLAAAQLTTPEQSARVRGVAPLIDAFSAQARSRYTTWLVFTGALAVVLLGLVVGFSRGLMRLSNAGLAILLGAAAGAFVFDRARRLLPEEASLPAGPLVQGVFSALSGTLAYIATALPGDLVSLALRNHLVLLLIGAALILLALVLWLGLAIPGFIAGWFDQVTRLITGQGLL